MPPPPLSFRDPVQLDLASVSSIQVVGVVEALIQNADTLFPGGRARARLGGLQQRVKRGRRDGDISPSPGGGTQGATVDPRRGVAGGSSARQALLHGVSSLLSTQR